MIDAGQGLSGGACGEKQENGAGASWISIKMIDGFKTQHLTLYCHDKGVVSIDENSLSDHLCHFSVRTTFNTGIEEQA